MAIRFNDKQIQEIEQLALNGCQNNTIANITGIALTTLKRRFGKILTKKRCERKNNLRTNQTNLAKTNPAMAIFLGKNELGQEDKQTVKTEATGPQMTEAEQKASEKAAKIYKMELAG